MFLYEKKILYLSHYHEGIRGEKAGFIRLLKEVNACTLDIHIDFGGALADGEYPLLLLMEDQEIAFTKISIRKGTAAAERQILWKDKTISVGGGSYPEEKLQGISIRLDEKNRIASCSLKERPAVTGRLHKAEQPEQQTAYEVQEPISENKWEQLQKNYQKIHPFGDERIFLTIEPKDFIILQAPYQKLVNNSFLLHGFYNYRHLLLGPAQSLDERAGEQFYLGVPGTYFEREKMVAVMFGFEGFVCEGPVEVGKFGYYMRRVEI